MHGEVARACASRAASRPPSARGRPSRPRCRSACGRCRRSRRSTTSTTTTRSERGASGQPRRSAVQRQAHDREQQQRDPGRQVRHVRADGDGERSQHPGRVRAAATARRLTHARPPAPRTAPARSGNVRGAPVPTLVSIDVPGSRRPKASPRSWASSTQRHSCASRASASKPRQAVPVEDVRDDVGAGDTASCAGPGRAHTPSTRCDAASRRPGTAAGRRSPRRRGALILRAAGVGRDVGRRRPARAAGRGQAIAEYAGCTTAQARNRPSGWRVATTKRSSATRPRRCAGRRSVGRRSSPGGGRSAVTLPACAAAADLDARVAATLDDCSSSSRNRTSPPAKPGTASSRRSRSPGQRAVAVVHGRRDRGSRAGT